MNIAVITTSFPSLTDDISGHFVLAEVRALAQEHTEVDVYFPRRGEVPAGLPHNVRCYPLEAGDLFGPPGAWPRMRERPSRSLNVVRFRTNLRGALRGKRYTQIIAHWLLPTLWPCLLPGDLAPTATQLVAIAHGSDVALLARLPRPLVRSLVTHILTRNVTLRFVAEHLRQRLLQHLDPALGTRLLRQSFVEPCVIDVETQPPRDVARRELGVEASATVLLIVGRLIREKNVGAALAACQQVPQANVVVIGDGPERCALELAAPRARFLGAVPRHVTLRWLRAADLLVSASPAEGAPTVIREALALGTAVVATPWGNAEDLTAFGSQLRVSSDLVGAMREALL